MSDQPQQEQKQHQRGVQNLHVVDLITKDPETGEVVLVMVEDRPWKSNPDQINQLEDKFNSYLDYVLEGFLVRDYPQYSGLPVRFQCDCREALSEEEQDFFDAASHFASTKSIRFMVQVQDENYFNEFAKNKTISVN